VALDRGGAAHDRIWDIGRVRPEGFSRSGGSATCVLRTAGVQAQH
jgi:hypothetical protein